MFQGKYLQASSEEIMEACLEHIKNGFRKHSIHQMLCLMSKNQKCRMPKIQMRILMLTPSVTLYLVKDLSLLRANGSIFNN